MENTSTTPRLVHIAVRSKNPARLAGFYKDTFDMKIVLRGRGAVDLWDGNLFLAINPPSPKGDTGLEHFGFVVKNAGSMTDRLKNDGASKVEARPPGRSFTDWRVHDPEGNPIDLSERGYNTIPPEQLQSAAKELGETNIKRLAIITDNPSKLAAFYKSSFGMTVSYETPDQVMVTDGEVELVLLSRKHASKEGIHCFGFCVTDKEKVSEGLKKLGISMFPVPNWKSENQQQYFLNDPDGNLITFWEGNQ